MSEFLEYGGMEEGAKELLKIVHNFYKPDFEVIYDALNEMYLQGREDAAQDIDNAIIEVAGDSAHTMRQAARIARGKND